VEWSKALIELDELRIPKVSLPATEQVVAVTDRLCTEHLDEQYADLCRRLTAKLARKRPSPLARGDLRIWAAGVIYALGQTNFLFDPAQRPHLNADELSELLGVKKTTMANKAKLIRDTLKIGFFSLEFQRRDVIDRNPLAWFVEVDGLVLDARMLPSPLQQEAHRRGLIPYLPA